MRRRSATLPAPLPLVAALLAVVVSTAAARGAIYVNSTADTVADEGACTLREAATAVNTQSPSGATAGECAAGDAGQTRVSFTLAPGSTIALTGGAIVFERPVWVWGPGMDALTITLGAGSSRLLVFDGRVAAGGYDIMGLTLAYGEGTVAYDGAFFYGMGGGLLVIEPETLLVAEVRFVGNTALFAGAALAISSPLLPPLLQDLEFDSNLVAGAPGGGGAAIYFDGSTLLQLRRALFVGNRVLNNDLDPAAESQGGAIWIPTFTGASLALEESTFSANEATGAGGAIAFGTAAIPADVAATIWDCTFTLNVADNNHNSPAQSGGALYLQWNAATTTLTNTIVAGNTDGSSAARPAHDLRGTAAVLTSGGFNRIGVASGAAVVFPPGLPNANDDWVGSAPAPLAAGLGPLAEHGGPTRAHAPLAGLAEPLLDQGSCAGSFYDQRDWRDTDGHRSFDQADVPDADDACDIGALEVGLLPPADVFADDFESGDTRDWSGVVAIAP